SVPFSIFPTAGIPTFGNMTKTEKRTLLELISKEDLETVFAQLQKAIPEKHPDAPRLSNLNRRFRELEERIEMGTLSAEDVSRLRSRVAGGLRDIIQEYKTLANHVSEQAAKTEKKSTFKLDLAPETSPEEPTAATPTLGYFGAVDYSGSPTMQMASVTLHKSYGAAFHTCREAVRKAGMQMDKADRDGGTLAASIQATGGGGYGEKILFWVTPIDGATTKVQVVVDSQLPTLSFDFGRHKQKLGILVSYLR
ncbi:MAG: hypothetical protein AAF840_01950, partial [Bacteroidota bacterium]